MHRLQRAAAGKDDAHGTRRHVQVRGQRPHGKGPQIGRGAQGARSLTVAEAKMLYGAMLDGQVADLELGAILLALRMKSESSAEMNGFMQAISERLGNMKGALMKLEREPLKASAKTMATFNWMDVIYYEEIEDGSQMFEVDTENYVLRVNGVDRFATRRRNLGRV